MDGTEAVEVPAELSPAELRLQRNLKILVAGLGVLLAAGLFAIVGRILYLASGPSAQPVATVDAARSGMMMQLPAGAEVRSISVSGDRLAVHYLAAGKEGIAVLDLRNGKPLAEIGILRGAPTN